MSTLNEDVTRPEWCPAGGDEPCEIPLCVIFVADCSEAMPDRSSRPESRQP